MSPDKQRIAIAETCGWQRIRDVKTVGGSILCGDIFKPWKPTGGAWCDGHVPEYCVDLNAMREAMRLAPLGFLRCSSFDDHLSEIVRRDFSIADHAKNPETLVAEMYVWHASAAQHAEAFLRTIGKWEDT